MTHPLTPCEKVELKPCPFCGGDAVAGSNFDNDHYVMCGADCDKCGGMVGYMKTEMAAIENWNRRTALASGSGDHAELAKLADLLDLYAAAREDEFTVEDVQLIDRGSGLISALLAEVAALRGVNYVQSQDMITSEARATEAERNLAEAVGVVEWYGENARLARLIHSEGDAGRNALADDGGKRARTFLSKEAERG